MQSLRARGGDVRIWGNGPGDTYSGHTHPYTKALVCLDGSITFHTPDGDLELRPGDRLELDPDTRHSATVGPHGCECAEVAVDA